MPACGTWRCVQIEVNQRISSYHKNRSSPLPSFDEFFASATVRQSPGVGHSAEALKRAEARGICEEIVVVAFDLAEQAAVEDGEGGGTEAGAAAAEHGDSFGGLSIEIAGAGDLELE